MKAITSNNLTKIYNNVSVVNGVSITVNKGDIYGLIGKNGAGKTTFLRMLTGVSKPTSGSFTFYDDGMDLNHNEALRRVGSLIDFPSYNPSLSAFKNMKYVSLALGINNDERLKKLLVCVGLDPNSKKVAKDFSLGMKQRLAIAMALIGNPKILILDEPVNGMDPTGIFEIRELLLDLNKRCGVTILISSHLLAELSKIATCYGILSNGKLIKEIRGEELKEMSRPFIKIVVDDIKKAVPIIAQTFLNNYDYQILPENTIHIFKEDETISHLESIFTTGGVKITEVSKCEGNLEEQLLSMLGGVKTQNEFFE